MSECRDGLTFIYKYWIRGAQCKRKAARSVTEVQSDLLTGFISLKLHYSCWTLYIFDTLAMYALIRMSHSRVHPPRVCYQCERPSGSSFRGLLKESGEGMFFNWISISKLLWGTNPGACCVLDGNLWGKVCVQLKVFVIDCSAGGLAPTLATMLSMDLNLWFRNK